MLKKREKAILAITIAAILFTSGFLAGRSTARSNVEFYTAEPETAAQDTRGGVITQPELTLIDDAEASDAVNINTASHDELMSLPGIGDVLAQRIIDYRTENGPFAALSDIMKVKGIGQSVFDSISGLIAI